jgi:DNA-binding PadR family transcriptional regulator
MLKTLERGSMHGYGITLHIQRVSSEVLRVEEGSLYPALHRMEQDGWISAEWGGFGEQPARALLPVDGEGPEAACRRREELGATLRGRG